MRAFAPALVVALFSVLASAQQSCVSGQYELVDPSQRPKTRNCETKGKLLAPQVISTSRVNNYNACIVACKNSPSCLSFGYKRSRACTLYSKRLIDMKYQQRSTDLGTTFANKLCYKCKPVVVCSNDEAVTNGDFTTPKGDDERQAEDWTLDLSIPMGEDRNYLRRRTSPGPGGPYVECNIFNEAISPPYTAAISQQLSCAQIGTPYQLDLYFAGMATTFTAYLDDKVIYSLDCPDGACVDDGDFPPTGAPPILPVIAQSSTPTLKFVIQMNGNFSWWAFDSVTLQQVLAA